MVHTNMAMLHMVGHLLTLLYALNHHQKWLKQNS